QSEQHGDDERLRAGHVLLAYAYTSPSRARPLRAARRGRRGPRGPRARTPPAGISLEQNPTRDVGHRPDRLSPRSWAGDRAPLATNPSCDSDHGSRINEAEY